MEKAFKPDKKFLALLLFVILFLVTRLPRLNSDEINPDGVNWHYRMQQFVVGLKTFQLEKTYQHYHPGVTLMWISGIPVEIYKQISGISFYDVSNFQNFHLVAKVSLVLAQLVLSILAIVLLAKIVGFKTGWLAILLLSLEPFFLGNSRLFHMDVLFSLILLNALMMVYLSLKQGSARYALFGGIFLTLSFLTKSIGITSFAYVIVYAIIYLAIERKAVFLKKFLPALIISAIISLFLFFPAMFKGPFYYIGQILGESERIGIRNGHSQIILGQQTEEAGLNFYPLVLLMKLSPFTVLGLFLFLLSLMSKRLKENISSLKFFTKAEFYLTAYYLAYFVLMSFFSKKIDRYMVPIFPLLCLAAVLGYQNLINHFQKIKKPLITAVAFLALLFVVYPNLNIFPYQFTYTSPIFGSTQNANKVIAQKPFGIGIFEIKDALVARYCSDAKLGFIDVKPIEAIYPNSRVFDIRDTGPGSYDYIVLGINESVPGRITEDQRFTFEKDYSLWINGLEYWRVYAKKSK